MFGKRIVELRKGQGLTQAELARTMGISRSALSLYEIEKREPDIETLNKLASLFNVPVGYILGNDTHDCHVQNNNNMNKAHELTGGNFFFFFFDEENLLRDIFTNRIKSAIADKGLSENDFKKTVPIGIEKATSFLEGKGEPTADDLIELSQFLDTSIDYLLGQIPKLNREERKLLNSFVKLNADQKDIIIGKTKELLIQQEFPSVAADEELKKTGTDNMGK